MIIEEQKLFKMLWNATCPSSNRPTGIESQGTLPSVHFLSWIVICGILLHDLSTEGADFLIGDALEALFIATTLALSDVSFIQNLLASTVLLL